MITYLANYVTLNDDGMRVMVASYMHLTTYTAAAPVDVRKVTLDGVLLLHPEGRIEVPDYRSYLDPAPGTEIVRPRSRGVAAVDQRLQELMQTAGASFRRFGSLEEMLFARDRANDDATAHMIARGVLRRVSAEEERRVMARRGLAREGE
jgi:hypothetical protein